MKLNISILTIQRAMRITLPQAISLQPAISLVEGKYNFTLQQHDSCLLAAQNSVSIPNGNLNLAYVRLA